MIFPDKTMNFSYKDKARKITLEAFDKFYLEDKRIFQKIKR